MEQQNNDNNTITDSETMTIGQAHKIIVICSVLALLIAVTMTALIFLFPHTFIKIKIPDKTTEYYYPSVIPTEHLEIQLTSPFKEGQILVYEDKWVWLYRDEYMTQSGHFNVIWKKPAELKE